jgi:ABC-type branched-subunit amino acid transport system substrate-binding protein
LAVVYQNNEFGKLLLPLAEKIIVAEGAEVVAARPLDAGGADAVAVAQGLAALRPHAVIMLVTGPAVVSYIKANRAYLGAPIYTLSLAIGSAILKALGEDVRGVAIARTTPYPWRATTPLTRDFNQGMKRLDKPVDYDHFTGYINARILIEGLRGAGKDPSAQSLAQAMEKLTQLDIGGYRLAFSPENHHGSNFVEITVMGPNGTFMR